MTDTDQRARELLFAAVQHPTRAGSVKAGALRALTTLLTRLDAVERDLQEAREECTRLDNLATQWSLGMDVAGARCEKLAAATGPDREIDQELAKIAGWVEIEVAPGIRSCREPDGRKRPHGLVAWAPHYTASIDAAMTLVPEGWRLDWLQHMLDQPLWTCGLYRRCENKIERFNSGPSGGPTPAIALCIAALAAREAL